MEKINILQEQLVNHSIYSKLQDIENLKIFMKYHVYAVFDFMSLLKSLQNKIAPANNIWTPSPFPPRVVRFINEITIAEESDEMLDGRYLSHFEMYLKAMEELNIETTNIKDFIQHYLKSGSFDFEMLPVQVKGFVAHNLNTALSGDVEEVLGSFLFGREKLIPEIFTPILNSIQNEVGKESLTSYYFQRHIDIDGEDHGPMAKYCFETLCDNTIKRERALQSAEKALIKRLELWDEIYSEIEKSAFKSSQNNLASI